LGTFHFPDERLLLKMWEIIPDDNFGLNLDPSHLILQMIDYGRVVREFSEKLFYVHVKDLQIDRDGLYNNGMLSRGIGWQIPRLPGLGDVDWEKFFAALKSIGYDDVVSMEHEDRLGFHDPDLVRRDRRALRLRRSVPVPGASERCRRRRARPGGRPEQRWQRLTSECTLMSVADISNPPPITSISVSPSRECTMKSAA